MYLGPKGMCGMVEKRPLILIVDDVALNRALLSDILSDKYNIIEAENGNEALLLLREKTSEISLVLLDMVMPEKDGLEVLAIMNKNGWINEIPVIMISAENAHALIEGAYMLGVTDFIARPFDEMVLKNRVNNTIRLYKKQKSLSDLVLNQIYEKTRNNSMMVTMLSHIVEFRNGESGMHVLHINTITEMLLRALLHRTKKYQINKNDHQEIPDQQERHRHHLYGVVHARHRKDYYSRRDSEQARQAHTRRIQHHEGAYGQLRPDAQRRPRRKRRTPDEIRLRDLPLAPRTLGWPRLP